MYTLENETIRIEVNAQGAELQSVYDKTVGYEWLWQGDSKWWGKRAPVLFPFVGCLKEGKYEFKGHSYAMSKHGFARDREFTCVLQDESQLVFSLKSDEMTKAVYPFEFELKIIYTLTEKQVKVTHQVINLDESTMLFSLGGHPAFNCPMDQERWMIEFEKDEQLESYGIDLATGLIVNEKTRVPSDGKVLKLKSDLFEKDALVFENLNSKSVILRSETSSKAMKFDFNTFPLLALWSPRGPFVCLEPWFGMADFMEHNGQLEEKYGVEALAPKGLFEGVFSVTFVS